MDEQHQSFEAYCTSKNIDPELFKAGEPQQFASFKSEFEQMHPKSFTQQKLFLINDIRRRYLLKEES